MGRPSCGRPQTCCRLTSLTQIVNICIVLMRHLNFWRRKSWSRYILPTRPNRSILGISSRESWTRSSIAPWRQAANMSLATVIAAGRWTPARLRIIKARDHLRHGGCGRNLSISSRAHYTRGAWRRSFRVLPPLGSKTRCKADGPSCETGS